MRDGTPRHQPRPSLLVACGLVIALAAAACGGDQRVTETADSAVAYGATPFDSGRVGSSSGSPDTAWGGIGGVWDGSGYIGIVPDATGPEFVLIADSVAGREIYNGAGTCFTCHALDGAGVEPLGSSLRDSAWTYIDGSLQSIARVIRDGLPAASATQRGMPAFGSRLSDEDLRRLTAYTYSLSHPGAAVADTAAIGDVPPVPADGTATPP